MVKKAKSTDAYRQILKDEQVYGLRKVNQIRFVFIILFCIPIFTNYLSDPLSILPNLLGLGTYALVTILHSWIIYNGCEKHQSISGYVAILIDYLILTSLCYYYWQVEYPDNFAFILKNPLLLYYFYPIALSSLEFKFKPLIFSVTIAICSYLTMVIIGFNIDMPIALTWKEYVTGDGMLLSDIQSKPLLFLLVGGTMLFASYRVRLLLQKTGELESKKAVLARYFSPAVVNELTETESQDGGNILKSNRKYAVILFSDIRKFTNLSENMDPEELANFLAEYRTNMLDCIFSEGGTLDKFVGDAVMAVFGIPTSRGEEEENQASVRSALKMLTRLEQMNKQRESKGQEPIQIGIGLHAGVVFSGNIESAGQMEYTVIGDAVNVASRLESLTKEKNVDLLISEEVASHLGKNYNLQELGSTEIRGKSQKVRIFSIGA